MDVTRLGSKLGEAIAPGTPGSPIGGGAPAGGQSFAATLMHSMAKVGELQQAADAAIKDFTIGGSTSLHDTMIALEKAETSFKLMMQVRNKIVDAYHEILRMQI